MILGLTGHIASGKSTVAKALARRGALIVDADQLAREVVAKGSPVLTAVVNRFGGAVLTADGCLDRAALGDIVFAHAGALKDLNALVHPAIRQLACQRLAEAKEREDVPLIVYDAALLFEVEADRLVDRVLLVVVDPQQQLKRLMGRNGLDKAEAMQRIAAQQGLAEKMEKADYVIDNSGNADDLEAKVAELWKRLVGENC